jgi:hypothetical protein
MQLEMGVKRKRAYGSLGGTYATYMCGGGRRPVLCIGGTTITSGSEQVQRFVDALL